MGTVFLDEGHVQVVHKVDEPLGARGAIRLAASLLRAGNKQHDEENNTRPSEYQQPVYNSQEALSSSGYYATRAIFAGH